MNKITKTIINESQRGFLFKNGKYIKFLECGKYSFFNSANTVYVVNINHELQIRDVNIELLLQDKSVASLVSVVDVPEQSFALHFVDGKFKDIILGGKHVFWDIYNKHTFDIIEMTNTEVGDAMPKYLVPLMPSSIVHQINVPPHQKARLYYDNKFIKLIDEGVYYFFKNGTKTSATFVDTRLLQMDIAGQELLSLDKVALRINFVCKYKITDYIKIDTEIDDYEKQLHITLQLALRDYIAKYRLDEILQNKDEISALVLERLKEKQADYYIEIFEAGIKDIILPGEIRNIMNTVLIAEKRAQANVITRREEVASTRSLLNTAKLMDENQTLYKLKELEYMEKICENVGNITVAGGNGILTELTKIMKGA